MPRTAPYPCNYLHTLASYVCTHAGATLSPVASRVIQLSPLRLVVNLHLYLQLKTM